MWPVYLFLLVMNATVYTSNSQTPFILSDLGVASASTRAHLQSINQTLIVLSAFAYPLTRRFLGSRWIPAFFLAMAGTGLVLLGSAHSLTQVGIALAFTGIGSGTLFPHQSNLILSRATSEIQGPRGRADGQQPVPGGHDQPLSLPAFGRRGRRAGQFDRRGGFGLRRRRAVRR